MEPLLKEIERALGGNLYYLALTLALQLPDICAALEAPNGKSNGNKYRNWFDQNLASEFCFFNAEACYELRCGVVHEATLARPGKAFERVIFMPPNQGDNYAHDCVAFNALILNVEWTCNAIIRSVRTWVTANAGNSHIENSMERIVQFRPEGLPPYISGLPVIA